MSESQQIQGKICARCQGWSPSDSPVCQFCGKKLSSWTLGPKPLSAPVAPGPVTQAVGKVCARCDGWSPRDSRLCQSCGKKLSSWTLGPKPLLPPSTEKFTADFVTQLSTLLSQEELRGHHVPAVRALADTQPYKNLGRALIMHGIELEATAIRVMPQQANSTIDFHIAGQWVPWMTLPHTVAATDFPESPSNVLRPLLSRIKAMAKMNAFSQSSDQAEEGTLQVRSQGVDHEWVVVPQFTNLGQGLFLLTAAAKAEAGSTEAALKKISPIQDSLGTSSDDPGLLADIDEDDEVTIGTSGPSPTMDAPPTEMPCATCGRLTPIQPVICQHCGAPLGGAGPYREQRKQWLQKKHAVAVEQRAAERHQQAVDSYLPPGAQAFRRLSPDEIRATAIHQLQDVAKVGKPSMSGGLGLAAVGLVVPIVGPLLIAGGLLGAAIGAATSLVPPGVDEHELAGLCYRRRNMAVGRCPVCAAEIFLLPTVDTGEVTAHCPTCHSPLIYNCQRQFAYPG